MVGYRLDPDEEEGGMCSQLESIILGYIGDRVGLEFSDAIVGSKRVQTCDFSLELV